MLTAAQSRSRMGPATVGSVAFHVLLALALPALVWTAAQTPAPETLSFDRIQLIEITPRQHTVVQPRPVAPHRAAIQVSAPVHRTLQPATRPAHHAVARPHPHAPLVAAAPVVAAQTVSGSGTSKAVQPTTTTAPRQLATAARRPLGGYLPFGAEMPVPVLDPAVLKALLALGVHTTLVVTVGESGHTENVAFDPTLGAAMQTRIQALLADANWDPAVCGGGVTCQGRATIKL